MESCTSCKERERSDKDTKGDVVFVSDDNTALLIKDMLGRAKDSVLIASPWMCSLGIPARP